LDAGHLELRVGLGEVEPLHRRVREEHLGIDPVAVKRLQAGRRVIDPRGHLFPARRRLLTVGHRRRAVDYRATLDLAVEAPALDLPPVVFDLDDLGDAVTPALL
jgi:hypothetical protein